MRYSLKTFLQMIISTGNIWKHMITNDIRYNLNEQEKHTVVSMYYVYQFNPRNEQNETVTFK